MKEHVVIIGAGPAGLSFARSLSLQGIPSTVVEKQSLEHIANPRPDGRDIALTHRSQASMAKLGSWDRMPAEEIGQIRQARVMNGDSDYCLHFHQADTPREQLGFIVSNHVIRQAAYDAVRNDPLVDLVTAAEVTDLSIGPDQVQMSLSDDRRLTAPLAVAADSRFSACRQKAGIPADLHDFGKTVIVCRMRVEVQHDDIAYECFHYGRTLAVLPLPGNRVSVVITAQSEHARDLMNLSPEAFSTDVTQRFKSRLGRMQLAGERYPYPLVAVMAKRFVTRRFALLGDAAVGMHPVTAHGFNLGLQSAQTLARGIRRAHAIGQDIGGDFLLHRYQGRHKRASLVMYHGTNGVVKLFNSDTPAARLARDAVLRVGNNLKPLKQLITNRLTEIDRNGLNLAGIVGAKRRSVTPLISRPADNPRPNT